MSGAILLAISGSLMRARVLSRQKAYAVSLASLFDSTSLNVANHGWNPAFAQTAS
ncbi:hypothetical protein D3C87_2169770 [compost metagenome]